MTTRSITIPLRLSTILASKTTQDARDIDDARKEMRALTRSAFVSDDDLETIDLYACERHGGCQMEQYTRYDFGL